MPACGPRLPVKLLHKFLGSTPHMGIATAFLWQQPLALLQAQPGLPPAFLAPVHRQFLLAGQQLRILDHHSSARALVQRMATLAATEAAEARAAARAAGDDWAGVPTAGAAVMVQSAGWWLLLLRTEVQGVVPGHHQGNGAGWIWCCPGPGWWCPFAALIRAWLLAAAQTGTTFEPPKRSEPGVAEVTA